MLQHLHRICNGCEKPYWVTEPGQTTCNACALPVVLPADRTNDVEVLNSLPDTLRNYIADLEYHVAHCGVYQQSGTPWADDEYWR